MKRVFIGSLCFVCTLLTVWGDAADELFNTGLAAYSAGKYLDAAKTFDQMLASYPSSANADAARIQAGLSYLYADKFPDAIDRLSKETTPDAKPSFRGTALYFTGLAQFTQGQKARENSDEAKTAFTQAITTLTNLLGVIASGPTENNKGYQELSVYYRALANFALGKYPEAEKDLIDLTTSPQFSASLSRPDYFLRLGTAYAVEANLALAAKKDATTLQPLVDKALQAFDAVSNDPNALVQANDANMSKAGVLFLRAQLDGTPAGYQKALDAFRLVRRKADMIPLQQQRLDQLRAKAQANAQASAGAGAAGAPNDLSLLIQREQSHLDEMKDPKSADPIIQALIGIAECYVAMKTPENADAARTVLHRLAHATLSPEQQKEVDFQILYSYVLGGQTDAADKALTDYQNKHGIDPNADSISYQIAATLAAKKDYAGALKEADRSLKEFPAGRYVDQVIAQKAQALSKLGRQDEADRVVADFLKANATNPAANQMLLTKAAGETSRGNFPGAAEDYKKVVDNPAAGEELQAAADVGYIQSLQSMQKFTDVIAEAKSFQTKFPNNTKVLPNVLLFSALAMDQTKDTAGAVAALQNLAKTYPQADVAPYALSFVVTIYRRTNDVPAMMQAATDLRTAFPTAYNFIAQAADAVSAELLKQKKFDDALALYQPLLTASKPEVAAAAQNKTGDILLAATKALGSYQSMQPVLRDPAIKKLESVEQAYLATLKNFPAQLDAVGDAFDGLVNTTKLRRSWGLIKEADMETALAKVSTGITDDAMLTRFELAKAGLVFVMKDGAKQFPAALERFKKALAPNPDLKLTRQESEQFGQLLINAHDYAGALKVYNDALANTAPTNPVALASAYYGLGASYLAQGTLPQAKEYFLKMKALPGGGAWNPHIGEADYGIALADEKSGDSALQDEALKIYKSLLQSRDISLQARAMLGCGRLLEKAGLGVTPAPSEAKQEYAVFYYREPHVLVYGISLPAICAEGLYSAGQAYEKAGDKVKARAQYDELLKNYSTSAPDWAAKAKAAADALGG